MIKTLLKKQFAEMFRTYLYDAKKNKKRSKVLIALYFVLFAVLMIVILGGLFTGVAFSLCGPLKKVGMDWLYFSLFGLVAVLLGAFGSVFNTYAGLYLAKDNDLLLSLPIPVKSIMTARLLGVYLMGLMYSALVAIPAVLVYQIFSPNVGILLTSLVWVFVLSILVLSLSLALGYVVAKISQKLKNKSFITVIISVVFIAAYYFFYYKAQGLMADLVSNAVVYGQKIKSAVYPLYVFGQAANGDVLFLAVLAVVVGAVFAVLWQLLAQSFLRIATSSGKAEKIKYVERKAARRSAFSAVFRKELKRFTASSAYMLNCGLGILLLPILGIAVLVKRDLFAVLAAEETIGFLLPVLLCAVICLAAGMNNMASPSVSLEGKNLWLLQSLPVSPLKVLQAKLLLQIVLTGLPTILCGICVGIALNVGWLTALMMLVTVLLCVVFMAFIDLETGLLMPNLTWTNEITPIKQNGAVMLSLLVHFFSALIPPAAFFFLRSTGMSAVVFLIVWSVIIIVLNALLYLWLSKKGTYRFMNL